MSQVAPCTIPCTQGPVFKMAGEQRITLHAPPHIWFIATLPAAGRSKGATAAAESINQLSVQLLNSDRTIPERPAVKAS